MQRAVLGLAVFAISGCATQAPTLTPSNSAELSFSRTAAFGGLPGKFDSIDGKRLEGSLTSVRVLQGSRKIGYSCPDVISVDHQATITASFFAGRQYVLDCSADTPAVIREQ